MEQKVVCLHCKGTGKLYEGESECGFCQGTGFSTNVVPSTGFYLSVDIVERMVFADWDALKSKEQSYLNVLISASYMDLNPKALARATLLEYFPVGTTTNEQLSAMLGEPL
jgi:hypothetical protein